MEQLQQLMSMMNAGCSALSWKTQDARHDNGKQPARAGAANLCLCGSRNRIFDDSFYAGAV